MLDDEGGLEFGQLVVHWVWVVGRGSRVVVWWLDVDVADSHAAEQCR
jgi:hypothetical protein